jgi:hypothetical protein
MGMNEVTIFRQMKNIAKGDLEENEEFVMLKDYKDLKQQLQSYKDKEDKIRELAKDFTGSYLYPIQVLEILDGTSQYESKNNKIVEIVNELNKYTMYPQQKLLFQELLQILTEGE